MSAAFMRGTAAPSTTPTITEPTQHTAIFIFTQYNFFALRDDPVHARLCFKSYQGDLFTIV